LPVFSFGARQGLQVLHARLNHHLTGGTPPLSATGVHPVKLMLLDVPQQRFGKIRDFQRPFKQIFNHKVSHLALIGYGHELITVNFKAEKKDSVKFMDEKISLDAIGAYGDAYADKISKSFFSSRNKISGTEILSLSKIRQVNMFVIRELLLTWRDESRRLRSPYFDYDDAEVKQALNTLMVALSKHISVPEEYFVPLLKKAVRQTLLVIFNPYDF
jgi:hypothetical protein